MAGGMNMVYKKRNFKIYDAGGEFIIHNSNLDFGDHHTHLRDFHTCEFIINLCIHKTVPRHLSDYLLGSIMRLTDDHEYKRKISDELDKNRKRKELGQKPQKYKNNLRATRKNCKKYHV